MNDLSLPSPVARARDLARLIAAEADAIERGRRLTEPVVEELHRARLFRMLYPRSVGGDEVEPAVYIDAVGELARADGSVGWCVVDRQQHRALRALSRSGGGAHRVWAAARDLRLGSAERMPRDRGAGRLPGDRPLGFRQRLPARELDGRARHRRRARRLVAPQQFRPADVAHLVVPGRTGEIARQLGPDRPARHGVGILHGRGPLRARGIHRHARGPDPAPRARPALRLPAADPLFGRHCLCRARHRPRHARRLCRAGLAQDPARHRPPRRQRGDPGRGGARRSPPRRRPLLPDRHGDRDLPPRRLRQPRSTSRTAPEPASPAPTRSPAPLQSPTGPTRPPASTRSSPAAPSSAASATSTPSRSKSSPATPITKPSAKCCSATHRRYFYKVRTL